MTHEPRTQEQIYNSLRNSLKGKIAKLRNFTDRSFNYIWTQAFSEEIQELEAKALVSELAGWIDYAGKELNEDDIEDLGLEGQVTAEQLNEFMKDEYLDEYVKIVGLTRFDGSPATGTVTIQTQSEDTLIKKGTILATTPNADGISYQFRTTEKAETSNGVTSAVDVPIEAVEVGAEYNVPADEIVQFDDPPIGVRGVTNPASTTGGEDEESNEELRTRAKNAVQTSSLGGTTDGIKGYIRQNVEGVGAGDIIIDEFVNNQPPFVDVIVDGGLDSDVLDAIEFSRPTGMEHNLVRPQIIQFGWDVDALGTDIGTTTVEEDMEDYLLNLGIGENFYEDDFIRIIMESDDDILNIDRLGGFVERVTNEAFTYSAGQSDYRLDFTYEDNNGSITVIDSDDFTYVQGSDYEVQDQTGDGWPETLVWIGTTPDDGQQFWVDYDVVVPGSTAKDDYYTTKKFRDEIFVWNPGYQETFDYNTTADLYELEFVPFDGSSSIQDNSGDTYAEGTDYEIIDDSGNGFKQTIDWSIGGGTPDNDESFTITYDQKVYHPEYEIEETPGGVIDDDSGDTYQEDTAYQIVDYTADDENDAIEWLTQPAGLADGDEFYFTYFTEGDRNIEDREKVDPGTISVTQV